MSLSLADVVTAHRAVAATRSRTAKVATLAELFRRAGADDARLAVSYLSGVLPQRRIGVGWRSLMALPPAAASPSLTLAEVDTAFGALAVAEGAGSAATRRELLDGLLSRASADEQEFLRAFLTGTMRQGALDGVVVQAIGSAFGVADGIVQRAVMLTGTAAEVAALAAQGGQAALAAVSLMPGRPIRPMLASSAKSPTEAMDSLGPVGGEAGAIVDCKLDGIRIQAHRVGGEVSLYTRSLDVITERLPEVVEEIATLPGGDLILDGEAIALDPGGRPLPFQVTGSRTASSVDTERLRAEIPLTTVLFDIMHRDGRDLLDEPATTRHTELVDLAPHLMVRRVVTADVAEAERFFADVVAAGHEGVVVKSGASRYAAGRRGSDWVKVKPTRTVDLVVLAVEWGSGRRQGWLSNIHLGARDPATGELVMVGKTFKGMTDEILRWQTERFTEFAVGGTDGWVVRVRPEQVVEIAYDGVLASTRYPGGVALRFARVVRYRDDKAPSEVDTLDSLRGAAG